ncbi:MAG TPA: hypothetical protein VLS93_01145, partial [Anaeromyxobacteraceae bacterium]|nr:hypothetical protein [Anaeromyxobacteraceae bacterium]
SPGASPQRSEPGGALRAVRSVLSGAAWAVRGPAGALGGAAPAAAGIARLRWMLGPLAPGGAHPPARPPRPLWKRALGVGG